MSEDNQIQDTAKRLRRLAETSRLSKADHFMAEQCLRRLENPLRLTIFGTDAKHAISLVNLMIGKTIIPAQTPRARIQFLYGEETFAQLQFRDGTQKRIDGSELHSLFDDSPTRVRLHIDLPVLKKLSIMLATESNPKTLCADVEKPLAAADIALWAGAEFGPPMDEVWENTPDRLRDHSYLVLAPNMEIDTWESIADDFVEVLRVDPRRALAAKTREKGVDKEAFRDAGGAQIVRTIKKEIDSLVQFAIDASEVLLLRHADQSDETAAQKTTEEPLVQMAAAAPKAQSKATPTPPTEVQEKPTDPNAPSPQEVEDIIQRVAATPTRRQVYSVPLGKVASRSRLLNNPAKKTEEKPTQRTVSLSMKNMPKKTTSRPNSKPAPKQRVKSRRSRPAATPWSLGI